ncbi:tRNA-His guanylyltransferase [Didymosphaeria variabile]|uniref:tRNA-His guanylyltransferase n=1 Tax=Didymosphaeria variabile TaxID=1932322 RepID=A0A9W8XSJ5_9PLEO|nr:tRNA-His guanylyltransferase [Didymosphaeria variabile]KAJ4358096.1 tRNA-His guanylyltransferase [Didymosphaeria variabile]
MPSPYVLTPAAHPSPTISNSKKPVKPISHSASASLSTHPKTLGPSYRPSPKRSPSMSVLEGGLSHGPPQIPNASLPYPEPISRKLSLPSQKSYTLLRQEAAENPTGSNPANTSSQRGGRSRTPPHQLMTMKELPSPPTGDDDDVGVRTSVMGSGPQPWAQSPPPPPTRGSEFSAGGSSGHGEMESLIVNPVIPPSPPGGSIRSHSRTGSSYSRAYSFPAPPSGPSIGGGMGVEQFAAFDWGSKEEVGEAPPEVPKKSKGRAKKGEKGKKVLGIEDSGWTAELEGRPKQPSKTQKEKERKKRGKAKIVTEHVDIIGDTFWERRPWILSGRAG